MDRWQAMKVFVKVAEAESFADAGRQLQLSPPAVTRIVSALEETIGTRLLVRTTRSVRLTEAGARYVTDCQRLLIELAETEAVAAGANARPKGSLTVTASAMFGTRFILPIITEYLDHYPEVSARGMFVDRAVNIIEEGVDVAIRVGDLPASGFTATRVGSVKRVICGAPKYFATFGVPIVPADLNSHRIVAATSTGSVLEWGFSGAQAPSILISPRLTTSTNEAAISAAERGWGLTRVLSYKVAVQLETGKLQTVLSEYEEDPLPIHVIHPNGRNASAKVRSFIEFAVERLRAHRHFN
ncbi:LysR family transcriptional regulator [Rhizobium sp. WYJ-E13]|uniref:LysR family transcriptional regulator n=1 Tax=Rhizobium sp. WYJ-E13 TaxID=2849093 RepID=UPI001C1F09D8|nr:LysR family transcriptional regulator [Rhizobium sp. WYJ-E13]QWW72455.1 LysR family transcriptional regulator [Rhizobium sp. WYJ-E13]